MPTTLSSDDPNLTQAVQRLRRICLAWGLLFLGMGVLVLLAQSPPNPLLPLPWLVCGGLLLLTRQPFLLATAAVFMGLSILSLLPQVNQIFLLDPIALLFGVGTIETVTLAFIRLVLMVMAWNQFLFYRMLYGTRTMTGMDPSLPPIPTLVPNQTDRAAQTARILAGSAIAAFLLAFPLSQPGFARYPLSLAYGASLLAVGLGLGTAFSPTTRRAAALFGTGLGVIILLLTLTSSRFLLLE